MLAILSPRSPSKPEGIGHNFFIFVKRKKNTMPI
jgi:hypothetical protein